MFIGYPVGLAVLSWLLLVLLPAARGGEHLAVAFIVMAYTGITAALVAGRAQIHEVPACVAWLLAETAGGFAVPLAAHLRPELGSRPDGWQILGVGILLQAVCVLIGWTIGRLAIGQEAGRRGGHRREVGLPDVQAVPRSPRSVAPVVGSARCRFAPILAAGILATLLKP